MLKGNEFLFPVTIEFFFISNDSAILRLYVLRWVFITFARVNPHEWPVAEWSTTAECWFWLRQFLLFLRLRLVLAILEKQNVHYCALVGMRCNGFSSSHVCFGCNNSSSSAGHTSTPALLENICSTQRQHPHAAQRDGSSACCRLRNWPTLDHQPPPSRICLHRRCLQVLSFYTSTSRSRARCTPPTPSTSSVDLRLSAEQLLLMPEFCPRLLYSYFRLEIVRIV